MVRRVMVGPRREQTVLEPASPVEQYWLGEFEYWGQHVSTGRMWLMKTQLMLTGDVVEEAAEATGSKIEYVLVGVDSRRRLIEIRPAAFDTRGALPLKWRGRYCRLTSRDLVDWLRSKGVPDRQEIDCKWQPQTQSIVGRWESVPEGRGE